MTILEDWPSLPPIRTSSGRDSRVSCETLSLHDPANSVPHSSDKPLPPHKFDSFFPLPVSADASPSSSVPSAFGLVASRTAEHGPFFSCFFPNKSASHALSKAMMSPGREGRKGASDVGTVIRTFVGFSGSIHQSGPLVHSGAVAHSNKVGSGPISGTTSGLKGYTVSSKGHSANIFTMMPPDVVGKKKPPGYESDEPTSPEVTCIGRVRRKKHCKAWDALVKESKAADKKGKGKKPGFVSPRRVNLMSVSPRSEKQLQSPSRAMPSRWKQPVRHGRETELQGADPHRQSNMEQLSSDLDRFNSASGVSSQVNNSDLGFQSPSEEENLDAADEGTEFPCQPPPPNCLLRMRNTAHSKEHYAHGELLGVASESVISVEKQVVSKPSHNASLWKRRMVRAQPSTLELKGRR